MKFLKTKIPDLILIEPLTHKDHRGYFFESYRHDLLEQKLGYEVNFVQDNETKSKKGVLRGLHFQLPPFNQNKLCRVIEGSILDIAVDLRKDSTTFGKHLAVELTGDNKRQLFIPKGFAHGYLTLSETAIFFYKVDNYFSPESQKGIAFDDDFLSIDWRLSHKDIHLSSYDKCNLNFSDYF